MRIALGKTHKSNSQGIKYLPNFWLSNYTSTHTKVTCFLNELAANPNNTPACLCQSSTYLLTIQNMKLWKTNLMLSHTNGIMRSDDQDIKCGIFQGDLSSPFFCLAPILLSTVLKKTKYGCKIKDKTMNHLFYMDDLKLYGRYDEELEGLLFLVKTRFHVRTGQVVSSMDQLNGFYMVHLIDSTGFFKEFIRTLY